MENVMKISPKQQRFCEEYLVDFNATRAYIAAGYSEKGAAVSASKLLTKPKIKEFINRVRAERSQRLTLSADNVVRALAEIAFADQSQLLNLDGSRKLFSLLSEEQRKWSGVRHSDRLKALELLGRHFAIFERDNRQADPYEHLSREEVLRRIEELEAKR